MSIVSIRKSNDPLDYIAPRLTFVEATLLGKSEGRSVVVGLATKAALATVYEAVGANGDPTNIPTATLNFDRGTHILTSPWVVKGVIEHPLVITDGKVTCPSLGADLVGLPDILGAFFARHTDEIIVAFNAIPDFMAAAHMRRLFSL